MRRELLRHKIEAIKLVGQHSKNFYVTIGPKFRRYHSDNAKELQYKDLLVMLKNQDTAITRTTPYSSQETGLVERRFHTLFNSVRTALRPSTHQARAGILALRLPRRHLQRQQLMKPLLHRLVHAAGPYLLPRRSPSHRPPSHTPPHLWEAILHGGHQRPQA